MASQKYWTDCLEEVLSEFEIKLPKERECEFIDAIIGIADMEWEATGQECIPHPLEVVKRDLEDKVKKVEREREQVQNDFIKNICRRNNCEPSDVTLEGDGYATIRG
jgi:hypothetical protein